MTKTREKFWLIVCCVQSGGIIQALRSQMVYSIGPPPLAYKLLKWYGYDLPRVENSERNHGLDVANVAWQSCRNLKIRADLSALQLVPDYVPAIHWMSRFSAPCIAPIVPSLHLFLARLSVSVSLSVSDVAV